MTYNNQRPKLARYAGFAGLALGASLLAFHAQSNNLPRYLPNQTQVISTDPDYYGKQFVSRFKDNILEYARKYDVPPEMIVAVLLSENYQRPKIEDIKDGVATSFIGDIFHSNPSLGPGQVNINTASDLDKKFGREERNRNQLEEALLDPHTNIEYVTMYLSELMRRQNRLPQSNVLDDPHLIAVIGSEYSMGPTQTSLEEARPSIEGQSFALSIAQTDFEELGKGFTITEQQRKSIEDYLKDNH